MLTPYYPLIPLPILLIPFFFPTQPPIFMGFCFIWAKVSPYSFGERAESNAAFFPEDLPPIGPITATSSKARIQVFNT